MPPRKHLKRLVILAALSLGVVAAGGPGALADEAGHDDAELIVVRGDGEARVRPDSLRVDVGVESRAATVDQARDQANRAIRDVIVAVRATAIAGLAVETKVIQLDPVYAPHRADQPPAIVGFSASNHVSVSVRGAPVAQLGEHGSRILDAAIGAGANSVGGLQLFLADPSVAHDDALRAAVAAAQHDADLIARAAGVTLAGLRSVEETESGHFAPRVLSLPSAVSAPIEVDDVVVQAGVVARFGFR